MKIRRKNFASVPLKIAFKTLGCKANRAESDMLCERFGAAGFEIVDQKSAADIYIINTCSVTNDADKKSRQAIRALTHARPASKVYVFGCGVKAHKDFYSRMSKIEFAGKESSDILREIGAARRTTMQFCASTAGRTRAIVKIQDGCNNSCSYCIVRILRGREKSYPMSKILHRINQKVREGYKEIVLTGINITSWRAEGERRRNFADLVRAILSKTSVPRLRISSMEPECVDARFARLLKNPRLCPHIHLPLQSGSDRILKLMRRKYDTKKFAAACRMIKAAARDAAITTDVIVGFPSETEKDFQETVRFCKKIGFAKIHVFPYSKRAGTPASAMSDQIDAKTKARRAKIMRDLSDKLRARFVKKRLGKIYEVLIEERKPGAASNVWSGLTPNYIKVNVKSCGLQANTIKKIKLLRLTKNNEVAGEIL